MSTEQAPNAMQHVDFSALAVAADCCCISVIRHGETAWNVDTRIQGFINIPLNERGQLQALRTAQAFADAQVQAMDEGTWPVAAVYASDLSRALETGRAIAAALGLSAQADAGMRERCYGEFEGNTWAEIADKWPHKATAWRAREPSFAPDGGESLLVFQDRIGAAFAHIASQHLGAHIVCVVHGGVMDVLYRMATDTPLSQPRTWHLGNASINRLVWRNGRLHLHDWGDVRHLHGLSLDESNA